MRAADACKSLEEAMADIPQGIDAAFPSPSNTDTMKIEYHFVAGMIHDITINFVTLRLNNATTSFSDQVLNLTDKYGKPKKIEDIPFQNGFGAQYPGHRAEWNMPDGTAIVCLSVPTRTVQNPLW